MRVFDVYDMAPGVRVRYVHDDDYDPVGTWALDTEEETRAAEQEERAQLESGRLVALGCIVEHHCAHCDSWTERDALWGIVIEPDELTLRRFAVESMDLGVEV